MFDKARKRAWREINDQAAIAQLIREQRVKKELQLAKRDQTATLLNIYK